MVERTRQDAPQLEMSGPVALGLLLLIVVGFVVAAASAMRHTSTTFDEILLPAAGARGYDSGDFSMVVDHPPLLQYVYGLPVYLMNPTYPDESERRWDYMHRYGYARAFFWQSGNDPERIAFAARAVGVAIGAALIVATFLLASALLGRPAGLIAALLVATLPDVLAHSGVSYNDVPISLALLCAAWSLDSAIRRPSIRTALLAGLALGLALAVKFSAIAIAPVALILLAFEAASRGPDRAWLKRLLIAAPMALLAAYVVLVAVYLGDFSLAEFWLGLEKNIRHANVGHVVPAVLLGMYSADGWWYFFPVAFLLKTSVALHVLILIAVVGTLAWRRHTRADVAGADSSRRARVNAVLAARLRVVVVSAVVFLGFVMAANLNIGFRHALPILPFLCILVAAGVVRAWSLRHRLLRAAIVAALAWHIISPLRFYPFFLSYLSEYTGPEEYSYEVLVDSSHDWGQGLLALRDFMQREGIDRVMLSYFGSALPEGYGIDYVTMPGYYPLPVYGVEAGDTLPRWVAISATNLAGNYLPSDPFAVYRQVLPTAIVGRSIFLFHLEGE